MKIKLPISDCRLPIEKKSSGARPLLSHASRPTPHARSGIALVITLIMLSIITFMTVTFLIISERERNSVSVTTEANVAKQAAEAGLNRAFAQIISPILATTNGHVHGMFVSTNYHRDVSLFGLPNLFYDPRTMVFRSNNIAHVMENSFYLDLNRNGRFDGNGMVPELNVFGQPTGRTNFVLSDPEWIGILMYPDQKYSSTNPYVARYAIQIIPADGLDVNYIYNQAILSGRAMLPATDGYYRNEGVGTWEINLAAFFADLNTNRWNRFGFNDYLYNRGNLPTASANRGLAFEDALEFLRYRYANNFGTLRSANASLPWSINIFNQDNIDEYSDGPLFITKLNEGTPFDPVTQPWAGSDNTNHFFTPQEFFDPNKTALNVGAPNFITRLLGVSTNVDTYNSGTYYRMISQLNTVSVPETGKLNLNWKNVDAGGNVVSSLVTNFVPWTPLEFFTNAANIMLSNYFGNLDYTNNGIRYVYPPNVSAANIQIYPINQYTPAVHRIMQLAANMYDATTNSFYPSVFRPLFTRVGTNVFITGYEPVASVSGIADPQLAVPGDVTAVPVGNNWAVNVYGAPWVIGAKKGLPNFNMLALESAVQITRKIQVTRATLNGNPVNFANFHTNVMYLFNQTNFLGVNCWNSYRTAYANPVTIVVRNYMTTSLSNSDNSIFPLKFTPIVTSSAMVVTNWSGTTHPQIPSYGPRNPNPASFKIPLNTELLVITNSVYYFRAPTGPGFVPIAYTSDYLEKDNVRPLPHMLLQTTNQTQVFMLDGNHVIDYVALNGPVSTRDLNAEIAALASKFGSASHWDETPKGSGTPYLSGLPTGAYNQIADSMKGNSSTTESQWNDLPLPPGVAGTRANQAAYFRAFFYPNNSTGPQNTIVNNQLVMQVPYTPTLNIVQSTTLQVNDPLVHYMASDLMSTNLIGNAIYPLAEGDSPRVNPLGAMNRRYWPWGGYPLIGPNEVGQPDPIPFSTTIKDPMMTSSDNWDFPTNLFPNIGWLGRVHRGTPWQTVYMKGSEVAPNDLDWKNNRTGNQVFNDRIKTLPQRDRELFDLFTTAINDNSTRGQLSVNVGSTNGVENLAGWSAVFSGVTVLTNVNANSLSPLVIQPAGVYVSTNPPPLVQMVQGINNARMSRPSGVFTHKGDVLSARALTEDSPFLDKSQLNTLNTGGISDAVMERIPQQVMSLLTLNRTPRFVIDTYGQTLRPAERSVVNSSALVNGVSLFGFVTNYQVTAETAYRAVVRVENAPVPGSTNVNPRIIVESFNVLKPD